ncbi:MAG: hypothetical protein AAF985_17975 [Bacteroidota bacterium]
MNLKSLREYLLLFLLLFIIHPIAAQEQIDYLHYDCPTSSYLYSRQFEYYFKNNQLDSVEHVLNLWATRCGSREVVTRAKTIFDLYRGQFDEDNYDEDWLGLLIAFERRMHNIRLNFYKRYEYSRPYYGYIPFAEDFDLFTQELAFRLQSNYPQKSLENELCRFYATGSDSLFIALENPPLDSSQLGKIYNSSSSPYSREVGLSFFTGVWIPTGDIQLFGVHPEIGLSIGGKAHEIETNLVFAIRILGSRETYNVFREQDNRTINSRAFFSAMVGLEFGRNVLVLKNHELQFNLGFAYENLNVFKEEEEFDSINVGTYNFNVGLTYRLFSKRRGFIGLRLRYHFVDYTLGNKLDINGFPYSIGLVFGGVKKVRDYGHHYLY